jgi:hypothetical protein
VADFRGLELIGNEFQNIGFLSDRRQRFRRRLYGGGGFFIFCPRSPVLPALRLLYAQKKPFRASRPVAKDTLDERAVMRACSRFLSLPARS